DEGYTLEGGASAAGGQQAHEGANGGGLAHSVAAEEGDDFTRSDAQADIEQHLRRAVGGLQMVDCKHSASLHLVAEVSRDDARIGAHPAGRAPPPPPTPNPHPDP